MRKLILVLAVALILLGHLTITLQAAKITRTSEFWQSEKVYALSKRDEACIYEDINEAAKTVGYLEKFGVMHILQDEENGWYYVESGTVRGFIRSECIFSGEKADKYVKKQTEDYLVTAEAVMDIQDNSAFFYTMKTAYEVYTEKTYALALSAVEIYDGLPEDREVQIVGYLEQDGLCYLLEEVDDEWYYVESGSVRGFVETVDLISGSTVEDEVAMLGEAAFPLAIEAVSKEENKVYYYSYKTVEKADSSNSVREDMISYAEKFLGNPYVWGGTSLTQGADCSGFVQSIYAHFGYTIPRVAEDQAQCGTKIAVTEAQPGDLIFYEKDDYIYHVVMYAGAGMVIEAQGSATGIIYNTLNEESAVWAVRIISEEETEEYTYGEYLGEFKLTAYCSCSVCCDVWSGGPTASGSMPLEGRTVAMEGLEFGTKIIIDGQVYTVEDRGTPYGHVDIYMNGHEEANIFGVQYGQVYLAE